jgi:hypothetical protein
MASSIHNLGNQRHRRNVAAVRISTTDLHGEPGHIEDGSIHKQELDILSPEPISPARGLKVQNSIPQLMKALPPLPSGVVDGERQDLQSLRQRNDEFDNKQVSNLSELRDTILESKVGHLPQEMPIGSTQVYQGRQSSPAKFKVRVKPSYSPLIGASSVQNAEAEGLVAERQYCSVTQIKPRLKLKLSRSQLGQGRLTPGEGIVRPNRLKQCNSLADLALYSTVGTNMFNPAQRRGRLSTLILSTYHTPPHQGATPATSNLSLLQTRTLLCKGQVVALMDTQSRKTACVKRCPCFGYVLPSHLQPMPPRNARRSNWSVMIVISQALHLKVLRRTSIALLTTHRDPTTKFGLLG